ncbi:hypothetical protein V6Z11_D08G137800 [Gossypium hirsutum]
MVEAPPSSSSYPPSSLFDSPSSREAGEQEF